MNKINKKTKQDKLLDMREMTKSAIQNKQFVLSNCGYTPMPHDFMRRGLTELAKKYDGQSARDSLVLFLYLSSYVNGDPTHDFYLWSYPTVEQIVECTGIHRNRVKKLCDILEAEGMVKSVRYPYKGHTKKVFLPILPVNNTMGE